MSECLFCRIAAGEIPADRVYEDEVVVAFRDINPQAPTHVLVIPRKHLASLVEMSDEDDNMVGRMLRCAARVAEDEGLAARGYRVAINTGTGAGQLVPHLHLHLLGGRALGWPPG